MNESPISLAVIEKGFELFCRALSKLDISLFSTL